MKLTMLPPARQEMLLAARWYDDREHGVGDRFLDEIRSSLLSIRDFPEASPPLDDTYRRKIVGVYSYGLIYRVDSLEITVVAVMHLKRRPGYWRKRLGPSDP